MRFLLDENVHRGLIPFLTKLSHDVLLSPKGLTNGKVLALAEKEDRVLVTHDSDFAAQPYPGNQAGIILIKIQPRNFSQLKASIERFLLQKKSPELCKGKLFLLFEDHWEELPPTAH